MSALSGAQLTSLRTAHPHSKKTYLSPVPHISLLSARVNDATIAIGEESIIYDSGTGTAAEYALVESGQTLLIGSAAGLDDLGRARVKSITGSQTSGTITVAWNSDILWADGAYLTILHFYEMWPLFPRFTVSPEVFYKDKTITYSDQNTNIYPVAIMGPAWAGWLVGGSMTIDLDSSNSYAVAAGASISSRTWSVATAIIGASPSIATPSAAITTITLDAPGLYWVKVIVTDSNSKTQTTLRPFIAHDTTDLPYLIQAASKSVGYERGGATLSFTVHTTASETLIPDKTLVVLWSDNSYAAVAENVHFLNSAEYSDRDHIDFVGYIVQGDVSIEAISTGAVDFQATTVESLLGNKFEYPVVLIADNTITGGVVNEWWKITNNELTVARALHHLWRWHSTLFEIADVHLPTGDTRIRAGTQDFTEGSLIDRATIFARDHGIFAKPVCNSYGVMYVEIDVQMLNSTDRAAVTDTLTLLDPDWRQEIDGTLQQHKAVADTRVSGGYWDGTVFDGFCSKFGTIAANDGTSIVSADKVMVISQAGADHVAGRLAAIANHPIKELGYELSGNYSGVFDVVPQQWVRLSLTGNEPGNKKGLVLSNIRAIPRDIQTNYNQGPGLSATTIVLVPEAIGRDGIAMSCPGVPDSVPEPDPPTWTLPEISCDTLTLGSFATYESGAVSALDTIGVKLSSTKVLVIYNTSAGGRACVLDVSGSTITPGTPVTFETNNMRSASAVALSATDVLVFYHDNTDFDTYAIILQISGTIITPGTRQLVESLASLSGDSTSAVAALSSTKVFATYTRHPSDGGTTRGVVLDVSGTTITVNTAAQVHAQQVTLPHRLAALSSSSVLMAYRDSVPSPDVLEALVISGITTTFTVNSATTLRSITVSASSFPITLNLQNSTTYMLTYTDVDASPDEFSGFIGTISGVTVNAPGPDNVFATISNGPHYTALLDDLTTAIIGFNEITASLDKVQASCAVISGITITLGTGGFGDVTTTEASTGRNTKIISLDNTKGMLLFADDGDTDKGKARILEV